MLLTDGITTEGASLTEAAAHAPPQGRAAVHPWRWAAQPIRDLKLNDLLVDEVVFVDDVVNFEFKLTGAPVTKGSSSRSSSRQDADQPAGQDHRDRRRGWRAAASSLAVPAHAGRASSSTSSRSNAQPLEKRPEDNHQERLVSVRKEQVRVLLVQSYPNYEFRYLKHMLERDSTIQLKTVLQDSDLEYAEHDQSALRVFPVRREELFAFDVVIFGDVNPAFLSPSVCTWATSSTEKGGGLVFIAGPRYTPMAYRDSPLAALLPIDFNGASGPDPGQDITEPIQPEPTDLGLTSPAMQLGDNPLETAEIWQNLPQMYWLFEAPHAQAGGPRAGGASRPYDARRRIACP